MNPTYEQCVAVAQREGRAGVAIFQRAFVYQKGRREYCAISYTAAHDYLRRMQSEGLVSTEPVPGTHTIFAIINGGSR